MKNLLLILVLMIMISSATFAQRRNEHKLNWKNLPRYDVRLGIGPEPLVGYIFEDWFGHDGIAPTLEETFYRESRYRGRKIVVPSLMAECTYRIGYRWEVGAVVSFHREGQPVYDIITDKEIKKEVNFNIGITPTARYMWLSRKNVRLYTSAALGIGVQKNYRSSSRAKVVFNGQFTYLGVAAGNKVFGFFDALSFGTHAFGCKAGVGYRF